MENKHLPDLRNLPDDQIPSKKITPAKTGKLKGGRTFIKGPIDLEWISKAAHLPGKAINVALALSWLSGLNKSKEGLKLTNKVYESFNVSRPTAHKALNSLEDAGLVKVERGPGRKNRVTILDPPPTTQPLAQPP